MPAEFDLKNITDKEEVKRQSIVETMENEEFDEALNKIRNDNSEKINFNTIDEDEVNDNLKFFSPKNFEDEVAQEMKPLIRKKTEDETSKPKEEVKDYM